MKPLSSYDLFLFDFDGLLVNTEDLHMRAYEMMLEKRGVALGWDFVTYATYAHRSTEALSSAIYGAAPALREQEPEWNVLREEKQAIYKELLESGELTLMPGVAAFLEHIGDKPKVVVTNSTREQINLIKPHFPELRMINRWLTRENYKEPKPAPDGYLSALTHYPRASAIGFEDTEKGIASLTSAGVEPVLIRPPHYPEVASCPNIFSSFEEIYQRK